MTMCLCYCMLYYCPCVTYCSADAMTMYMQQDAHFRVTVVKKLIAASLAPWTNRWHP